MTTLTDLLVQQIRTTGPMTVAQYMTTCLLHPKFGYYTSQTAFGADGDFTTAPEISQMFGELIGLCLAQCWFDQGQPDKFALAELGPGRGTLMADMLRATRGVPGFHDAMSLHLVEASPKLRQAQADRLAGATPTWHDTVDVLPDTLPLYCVANEFFDALPVRQFQRDPGGWREVLVGVDKGGVLRQGLSDAAPIEALDHRLQDTKDGELVESCVQATVAAEAVSSRIAANGGAALIVDYGGWRSKGDTFQAVKNHQPVGPFVSPGQADLTAHVDFEPLSHAAEGAGCRVSEMTPQGVFLERLGITARAQSLAKGLSGDALESHIAAHRRLTHPDEMGSLFKVLGIVPGTESLPPGLET